MKMIVGLGNPGARYQRTRHNLGFMVLDEAARQLDTAFTKEKHHGLLAQARSGAEKLLLVKPQTFMNLSGECVAPAARNAIQGPEDLLVVVDDVNLPLARMRFRAGGSAGGHNGLKSITERLGTQAYHRLRLGVGDERAGGAGLAEHVLSKFHPDEWDAVNALVSRAVEAVLCWIDAGIEEAMERYNGRPVDPS